MKLSNSSTVPVYTVSGSSTSPLLPEWLAQRRRRRSFKSDPEYANRIELLQDFEFEEASQCIRISEDGEWVMSTGTYKPQMHTHYLPNLSLSYARHTDTLNKTFVILSTDYSKTAHLQEDRSIEFHRPEGRHHSLRIPRYGRDLVLNRSSAELLVPAVGVNVNGLGEVFRINLDQGRFMKEYVIDVGGDDLLSMGGGALQGGINTGSVNTAAIAEDSHGLMAFGTSIGTVEYWDARSRARVAALNVPVEYESRPEITALTFHRSGISMAVGTDAGVIYLYDLRSAMPTLRKDHGYGFPVHTLQYLDMSTSTRGSASDPKILSCDRRILKLWDERSGDPWTSVEPAVDVNHVAWCKDSGMFLTANEGRQQHAFFIPQLAPAPKWCSFLDNVVEEMADDPTDPAAFARQKAGEIYHNHVYLTLPKLQSLSLDHLIGKTNLVRPYMHGYFIDKQLYEEARLIANPTSYEDERTKRVKEKIDKERESRIRGKKQVNIKVNRKLAEKLLEREEKNERRRAQRVLAKGGDEGHLETDALPAPAVPVASQQIEKGILGDSRFSRLFADEDYAVDETSREFQSLNPSTKPVSSSSLELDREEKGLTAVEEEAIDEVPGSSSDGDSSAAEDISAFQRNSGKVSSADYKRRPVKDMKMKAKKGVQLTVSSSSKTNGKPARDRSFGSRAETFRPKERSSRSDRAAVGEKVVTFEPGGEKGRRRNKMGQPQYENQSEGYRERKDRRSASGNTFRRM